MTVLTKQVRSVVQIGNSVGVTLREELLDLGAELGHEVSVTLIETKTRKKD